MSLQTVLYVPLQHVNLVIVQPLRRRYLKTGSLLGELRTYTDYTVSLLPFFLNF